MQSSLLLLRARKHELDSVFLIDLGCARVVIHRDDIRLRVHLADLSDHALARDVIGIYSMLQDETCNFLCADFDDGSFEKDIIAFKEACEESGIPVSIERSRSGNGAHAWIFLMYPFLPSQPASWEAEF